MKIYKREKQKTKVIGAPPFDWPWFEHFDNNFSNIAKINCIPNAIDQSVGMMNSEIKVVNVSDEEDIQTPRMLKALRNKLLCLGSKSIAVGYFAYKCVEAKDGSGSSGN
jgi:hypothetical protein